MSDEPAAEAQMDRRKRRPVTTCRKTISVDRSQWSEIEALADGFGQTLAGVIREALGAGLPVVKREYRKRYGDAPDGA